MRRKNFQELFERDRRRGDFVFAVVFLLFALFLIANLGEQAQWVKRTKLPAQPAFWPTVSLIGMGIFAALHLLGSVMSPRSSGRLQEVTFWLRSLEFVAYFLAYVWLVPRVGYLPSTILFALFLTARLGYRGKGIFAAAVGFAIAVVLIFRSFLQVKIPAGQIYEYLPEAIRSFAMINL